MTRPRVRTIVGAGIAVLALTVAAATPAQAGTTGSAHSAAALATPGSGIAPTTSVSGLASLLSVVFSEVVNPLTSAITAVPQQLLSNVASSLTGSGLQADNPSGTQTRPASGYPNCSASGWTATDCFGPVTPSINLAPVLSLSTGAVQGYATSDSAGYIGAARVADPNLTVLGINVGDLGVIDASASCSTSSCSATKSVSGGSLLGGALTFQVANGVTTATVNGVNVGSTAVNLTGGGVSATATVNGNLLTLKISLSLNQLLAGLGLSGLLGAVSGLSALSTTASLTVTVGPGDTPLSGSTTAWGLEVGVNLAADIKLSLLGLAGVEITAGSSTSTADLIDLKLAYAAATSGTTTSITGQWIPPGVI